MAWKPLVLFVLSAAAFFAAVRFPLNWLDRWPRLWLRMACFFALLPLLPFVGAEIYGTRRWLALPGGINFPCHYLVLTFFMFGAASLSAASAATKAHKVEIVALIAITLLALLMQPYFDAACAFLILVLMALTLMGHWKSALILGAASLVAIAIPFVTSPYRLERMLSFLAPENDALGRGFQLLLNLRAIATAPWFGPSTADSLARYTYLYGDLTVIAVRFGLAAASLVIVLLACVVAVGSWRAGRQLDPRLRTLGLLMSLGLGCWAWLASAWPLGLVPTVGLPLPLGGHFFASVFAALTLGFIFRAAQTVSEASSLQPKRRSTVILAAVIFAGVGVLLARMWTLPSPPTVSPSAFQQRGQIVDSQGIALTELRYEDRGRRYSLHYPYGTTLAQILGLVDIDGHGIEGLQLQYERLLSGRDGNPGRNLRLSIDLRDQLALETVLQPYLERYSGNIEALIMKPDGMILAAASLPSYDPNKRREAMGSLLRFRPATDTAQAGPMINPFYLAQAIETSGTRFLAGASTTADIADQLGAKGLHDALVRFGFDQRPKLDYPGMVSGRTYAGFFDSAAKPLTPALEKEFRRSFSQGWGVSTSQIRYAVSFTGLVTGSLPQPRLVADPRDGWEAPTPIIKSETATAMRETMVAAVKHAGHENMGGIWSTFRPKMPPYPQGDHQLRYAMSALFAPADQPQRLVFVKLSARKPLPKNLGIEIGTKLLEAVK